MRLSHQVRAIEKMTMNPIARLLSLTLIFLLTAPTVDATQRTIKRRGNDALRHALVIGNGDYAKGPLRNPPNDAADVTAALSDLGFQVQTLTNADQREMERAIREFGSRLKRGGVGCSITRATGFRSRGATI